MYKVLDVYERKNHMSQPSGVRPPHWVRGGGRYLTPVPYRGKPNEPCYLPAVAAVLAKVRGLPVAELAATTSANARRLFAWE